MNYLLVSLVLIVIVFIAFILWNIKQLMSALKDVSDETMIVKNYADSILKSLSEVKETVSTIKNLANSLSIKVIDSNLTLTTIREDQKIQNNTLTRIETNTIKDEVVKPVYETAEPIIKKKTTRTKKS